MPNRKLSEEERREYERAQDSIVRARFGDRLLASARLKDCERERDEWKANALIRHDSQVELMDALTKDRAALARALEALALIGHLTSGPNAHPCPAQSINKIVQVVLSDLTDTGGSKQ